MAKRPRSRSRLLTPARTAAVAWVAALGFLLTAAVPTRLPAAVLPALAAADVCEGESEDSPCDPAPGKGESEAKDDCKPGVRRPHSARARRPLPATPGLFLTLPRSAVITAAPTRSHLSLPNGVVAPLRC